LTVSVANAAQFSASLSVAAAVVYDRVLLRHSGVSSRRDFDGCPIVSLHAASCVPLG